MKYNDRKHTPLKWNWFLKIVFPIGLIIQLYLFVYIFLQLFGINIIDSSNNLDSILIEEGLSINDMKYLFWPIVIYTFYKLICVLVYLFATIGLWKWKSYGYKCVNFIHFVKLAVSSITLYFIITNDVEFKLQLQNTFWDENDINMTMNIMYAVFIFVVIFLLILFILNMIYYHKRKLLFNEYYVQPVVNTTIITPQKEVIQKPTTETNKTQNIVEDTKEKVEETNDENIETSTQKENNNSEDVPQTKTCPNCGKVIDSDHDNYCDNCGAKLK